MWLAKRQGCVASLPVPGASQATARGRALCMGKRVRKTFQINLRRPRKAERGTMKALEQATPNTHTHTHISGGTGLRETQVLTPCCPRGSLLSTRGPLPWPRVSRPSQHEACLFCFPPGSVPLADSPRSAPWTPSAPGVTPPACRWCSVFQTRPLLPSPSRSRGALPSLPAPPFLSSGVTSRLFESLSVSPGVTYRGNLSNSCSLGHGFQAPPSLAMGLGLPKRGEGLQRPQ